MKVGDRVLLIGYTLAPKWRGKTAEIKEVNGHMLTVGVEPCGTTILVFTKEVSADYDGTINGVPFKFTGVESGRFE